MFNNAKPSDTTASPVTAVAFSLGQQFQVGYWEYIVHSASFYPVVYETTGVKKPDSGAFLMLDVTVRNLDRTSSTRPPFTLVDEAGREFSETDTWDKDQLSALQMLNPTVAKRGHVWFDAPRAYYKLKVSGGFESGHLAYVDLVAPFASEKGREDWKQLATHSYFDLTHLPNSLADAPLTSGERAQIHKVTNDLSARVGSIALAEDGSQQILVQSCGDAPNCDIWIFIRHNGQLQLVLETGGEVVVLRGTFSRGFRDLAMGWHMGAYEEDFSVYRWNGSKYDQVDCYAAKSDDSASTVTADCSYAWGRSKR
ncbi:MAG: DUF4352 domain-containing protein [Acidobacteriia bacterium]|nr:DUF4352 domain-containing protein [Terriglobia bacterium]